MDGVKKEHGVGNSMKWVLGCLSDYNQNMKNNIAHWQFVKNIKNKQNPS